MDQVTRRILEGEDVDRVLAESVTEGAASVYYDFYANANGVNNRAAWCPQCRAATVKHGECRTCGTQYPDGSVSYGTTAGRMPT